MSIFYEYACDPQVEISAFEEGKEARRIGLRVEQCPKQYKGWLALAWKDGWHGKQIAILAEGAQHVDSSTATYPG